MINIALRFDDPSISSDHALEKEVIAICKRYRVKINWQFQKDLPASLLFQNPLKKQL